MQVRWTPSARSDLTQIIDYVPKHSSSGARTIADHVRRALETAKDYPEGFRPGRIPGTREILAHPNYVVVYRIESDAIVVLAVLHSRREYP